MQRFIGILRLGMIIKHDKNKAHALRNTQQWGNTMERKKNAAQQKIFANFRRKVPFGDCAHYFLQVTFSEIDVC